MGFYTLFNLQPRTYTENSQMGFKKKQHENIEIPEPLQMEDSAQPEDKIPPKQGMYAQTRNV